jgi:uncharacterized protein (DUF736 family)
MTGTFNLGFVGKGRVAVWKETSQKGNEYFSATLYKQEPTEDDQYNQRRVGTMRLFPE